ncbi:BTB/POZ domain-containing protein At5g47800 isoform X2 [Andrographis paniculata]|uniref:BTB/POZ domain-containing protein At5g47800 isoform X2 n=1 Tax=Andrographis paniculata TaxID=175694 RepID=UPI0021E93429|nr:BTB/POZ domain-containing protein At5g47800 isoform X2 [Andrographis paniculata]
MKFMKLGTRPDTFYTEEAIRTVISDVPSDLTVRINNVSYLLHKCFLVPKCGLLQRVVAAAAVSDESSTASVTSLELNDIPGGDEAFELCAKFCYGITINLSARNFAPALCAAKFLRMTESIENGNLIVKLESFFVSCILEGWKDSVVTLQNAAERVYEWSEKIGVVRRCVESIVDKILTPPSKVTWSYTYTRPRHDNRRRKSVPKDWWTEDISFLDIDVFRGIVTAVKSTNTMQPQLIGEALHVYAIRWLVDAPDDGGSTSTEARKRRILETIVTLIPAEKGSVSVKFLLRLLSIGTSLGASPLIKSELVKLSGQQLDEATVNELLITTPSGDDQICYDVDTFKTVLESYWRQWRRHAPSDESRALRSLHKVGKLVDAYLQVAAKDPDIPAHKIAAVIETLPGIARPEHNDLYKAIHTYLKMHPDLDKADKKRLCRSLDLQKLSPEVRAHAVRNEHLPLRTVVQVLFFEQEKSGSSVITASEKHRSSDNHDLQPDGDQPEKSGGDRRKLIKSGGTAELRAEPSFKIREASKGKEIR